MLDRIQSSVTELRLVTYAVAHDMKSPVTSIRGTLESALSGKSDDHWRDSICEAIEGLDRMFNLLNTSLDVAEAQAGALCLSHGMVDLSTLVRQLAPATGMPDEFHSDLNLACPAVFRRVFQALQAMNMKNLSSTRYYQFIPRLLVFRVILSPARCSGV